MKKYQLVSNYKPSGDQPKAITELLDGKKGVSIGTEEIEECLKNFEAGENEVDALRKWFDALPDETKNSAHAPCRRKIGNAIEKYRHHKY